MVGSYWSLREEFDDIFCNATDNYNLAIPAKITFKEGMDICKHKLDNSIIPFQEDRKQFHGYVAWHKNVTGEVCSLIWTPLSDEHSEGSFVNMNTISQTLSIVESDFWAKDQPNGGTDENFVAIVAAAKVLIDVPPNLLGCSSCLLSTSLLLQLDGGCRHSLMGNIIFQEELIPSN